MVEIKAVQENRMRGIRVEKITLNIGVGKEPKNMDKALKLLKHITSVPPVKTFTQKRIPGWGLRPGLPIGCKLTLRGKLALDLIPKLLHAKDDKLAPSAFDDRGNVAFGIHEYIDIADIKYEPEIGVMGLQVCITLERPGFRIKRRKIGKCKVPHAHQITKEDAMKHMKDHYKLEVA